MTSIGKREFLQQVGRGGEAHFAKLNTDRNDVLDERDIKGFDSSAFEATTALMASGKRAKEAGNVNYAQRALSLGIRLAASAEPRTPLFVARANAVYNLAQIKLEAKDYTGALEVLRPMRFTPNGDIARDWEVHALLAEAAYGRYEQMKAAGNPGKVGAGIVQNERGDRELRVSSEGIKLLEETYVSALFAQKLGAPALRQGPLGLKQTQVGYEKQSHALELSKAAMAPFGGIADDPKSPFGPAVRKSLNVQSDADLQKLGLDRSDYFSLWNLWALDPK